MTCLLDFPPAPAALISVPVALVPAFARATAAGPATSTATPTTSASSAGSPALSAALVRFVTDGLAATVDSYRAGQLSLARLVWELARRLDEFEGLPVATRTVTRMRWITQNLAALADQLAATGRELTTAEQDALQAGLLDLRDALGTLLPPAPTDPSGAGHPGRPVLVRVVA